MLFYYALHDKKIFYILLSTLNKLLPLPKNHTILRMELEVKM